MSHNDKTKVNFKMCQMGSGQTGVDQFLQVGDERLLPFRLLITVRCHFAYSSKM